MNFETYLAAVQERHRLLRAEHLQRLSADAYTAARALAEAGHNPCWTQRLAAGYSAQARIEFGLAG